jgi:3-deoxy-D-manno-octulosonate 8-phosphate phosphatase (KDO 8-P phosphatase)
MPVQAKQVKLLILDVDGVMTDGSLYFSDTGHEMKTFNSLDGHGLNMLKTTGVKIAILTGRQSKLVELRAQNLNIDYVYQGVHDKLLTFEELLRVSGFAAQECGYIGDDIIDLPPMRRVAFAATVPHSPAIVRENAHYVARAAGGRGAIREICELIMQAQGTYDALVAHYLR